MYLGGHARRQMFMGFAVIRHISCLETSAGGDGRGFALLGGGYLGAAEMYALFSPHIARI